MCMHIHERIHTCMQGGVAGDTYLIGPKGNLLDSLKKTKAFLGLEQTVSEPEPDPGPGPDPDQSIS